MKINIKAIAEKVAADLNVDFEDWIAEQIDPDVDRLMDELWMLIGSDIEDKFYEELAEVVADDLIW